MKLSLIPENLAVCRLSPDAEIPEWVPSGGFTSVTRTAEELSIVCDEQFIPQGSQMEPGWRALKVEGPLDFALTGILSALVAPLAKAKISIFAISTFDTDYLLIKQTALDQAITVLAAEGHKIER